MAHRWDYLLGTNNPSECNNNNIRRRNGHRAQKWRKKESNTVEAQKQKRMKKRQSLNEVLNKELRKAT